MSSRRRRPTRRTVVLAAACATAAAAAGFSIESSTSGPLVELRVQVSGRGTVLARPGQRTCRRHCVMRFRKGVLARLSAWPAAGSRFVGWGGGCSGRSACTIRVTKPRRVVARFTRASGLGSWSSHVRCTPILTTLPEILGAQESPAHGALESGGKFQPHLRGPAQQHLLNPPCEVGGTRTFVEVHGVVVANVPDVKADGDNVANLTDPTRPEIANPYMKTIHVEIDAAWLAAGVAPPKLPPLGTRIDVQGFVLWDPAHTDVPSHSFSGWELHPLAAWRPAH